MTKLSAEKMAAKLFAVLEKAAPRVGYSFYSLKIMHECNELIREYETWKAKS